MVIILAWAACLVIWGYILGTELSKENPDKTTIILNITLIVLCYFNIIIRLVEGL